MKFINDKIPIIKTSEMSCLEKKTQSQFDQIHKDFEQYFYCEINGKIYHKKRMNIIVAINELLGKIICEYFKDNQLKSEIIVNENNVHFLLTKCFFEEGYFYTKMNENLFPEIHFDDEKRIEINNIENITYYKSDSKKIKLSSKELIRLKYKLKMMIVNDFLRKQSDRWYNNFLIGYNENHCKLMPQYDFEHSFFLFDEDLYNSFILNFNNKNIIKYIRNDDQFQELLHLAVDLNMKKIFEKLFDNYPVRMKKEEIENYENIVKEQQEIIKKYQLIKM